MTGQPGPLRQHHGPQLHRNGRRLWYERRRRAAARLLDPGVRPAQVSDAFEVARHRAPLANSRGRRPNFRTQCVTVSILALTCKRHRSRLRRPGIRRRLVAGLYRRAVSRFSFRAWASASPSWWKCRSSSSSWCSRRASSCTRALVHSYIVVCPAADGRRQRRRQAMPAFLSLALVVALPSLLYSAGRGTARKGCVERTGQR